MTHTLCPRCGPTPPQPALVGDCWYCGTPNVAHAHIYTSTACVHGEHDMCRQATAMSYMFPHRCEFCGAACICACHQTVAPQQESTP